MTAQPSTSRAPAAAQPARTRPAGLPAVHRDHGLPHHVTIYEVGPRDGLQNESATVPTAVKAAFVHRLRAAGLRAVELTSLVRPDRVPQLADAEDLLAALGPPPEGHRAPVLVPNLRGLDRALATGAREVALPLSVTETFSRRNLGRSTGEALAAAAPVVARAGEEGLRVRGYLSMCFGDPWEGPVRLSQVVRAALRLTDLGCDELSLGDTIGVATPGHVTALLDQLGAAGLDPATLALHPHDTYGQALANALAALRWGVATIDASAGGLGGCPFAGSATGNLATEDLVWMLQGLGVVTGVDLDGLAATSAWMAGQLGRPSPSATVRALTAGAT